LDSRQTTKYRTKAAESLFENQDFYSSKISAILWDKNIKPSTASGNMYNGTNKRQSIKNNPYNFALIATKEVRKSMEQKKGLYSLSQTGNSSYRAP
jgi:hypothetical protein